MLGQRPSRWKRARLVCSSVECGATWWPVLDQAETHAARGQHQAVALVAEAGRPIRQQRDKIGRSEDVAEFVSGTCGGRSARACGGQARCADGHARPAGQGPKGWRYGPCGAGARHGPWQEAWKIKAQSELGRGPRDRTYCMKGARATCGRFVKRKKMSFCCDQRVSLGVVLSPGREY